MLELVASNDAPRIAAREVRAYDHAADSRSLALTLAGRLTMAMSELDLSSTRGRAMHHRLAVARDRLHRCGSPVFTQGNQGLAPTQEIARRNEGAIVLAEAALAAALKLASST